MKRKWLFIIVLLIILVALFSILVKGEKENKGVGTAGISKDEFKEIKIGETTNFELNDIIDKDNEWKDDKVYEKCVEQIGESKEEHRHTYIYKYYGEKGGYAIITLQSDYSNGYFYNDVVVIKKENFNLK